VGFASPLMIMVTSSNAGLARCSSTWALCLTICLLGGCHGAVDAHDFQLHPSDRILIAGSIPGDVTVELTADYQATVIDDVCAPKAAWPGEYDFRSISMPQSDC
jgi:hypothetical protein